MTDSKPGARNTQVQPCFFFLIPESRENIKDQSETKKTQESIEEALTDDTMWVLKTIVTAMNLTIQNMLKSMSSLQFLFSLKKLI